MLPWPNGMWGCQDFDPRRQTNAPPDQSTEPHPSYYKADEIPAVEVEVRDESFN